MSWYYDYYLGYRDIINRKIYPLGVFDDKQIIHPVLTRSKSFASSLYENFDPIKTSEISEELLSVLRL